MFSTAIYTTLNDIKTGKSPEASFMGRIFTDEKYLQDVANALKENQYITKLDLSGCGLTDTQLNTLVKALSARTVVLSELNLNYNKIQSYAYLYDLIESKKIQKLYIFDNPLTKNNQSELDKLKNFSKTVNVDVIEYYIDRPMTMPGFLDENNKTLISTEEKEHPYVTISPRARS